MTPALAAELDPSAAPGAHARGLFCAHHGLRAFARVPAGQARRLMRRRPQYDGKRAAADGPQGEDSKVRAFRAVGSLAERTRPKRATKIRAGCDARNLNAEDARYRANVLALQLRAARLAGYANAWRVSWKRLLAVRLPATRSTT